MPPGGKAALSGPGAGPFRRILQRSRAMIAKNPPRQARKFLIAIKKTFLLSPPCGPRRSKALIESALLRLSYKYCPLEPSSP